MARLAGFLKFTGTVDGISVYHHKVYGWIVRRKGGPDPDGMKKQERFERVRENGKEFGASAKAAGLLKRSMHTFLHDFRDVALMGRLTQVFHQLKNLDVTSVRGERSVIKGLETSKGKTLLEGFEFNSHSGLEDVLKASTPVKFSSQGISLKNLIPKKQVKALKAANQVQFKLCRLGLDFSGNRFECGNAAVLDLPMDNNSYDLILNAPLLNTSWKLELWVLQISFQQRLNGKVYSLVDRGKNVIRILKVIV